MHTKIWTFSIYVFMLSVIALTGVAILAIWGQLPKEVLWKSFASGGALSLLLISLYAGLKAAEHSERSAPQKEVKKPEGTTTMKI